MTQVERKGRHVQSVTTTEHCEHIARHQAPEHAIDNQAIELIVTGGHGRMGSEDCLFAHGSKVPSFVARVSRAEELERRKRRVTLVQVVGAQSCTANGAQKSNTADT